VRSAGNRYQRRQQGLRFQFGSAGSLLVVNTDAISANIPAMEMSTGISATTGSLWMRIQRVGSTWTQSWSPDRKTWSTVGSFTPPLALTSLGLFAGNYNDSTNAAPAFSTAIGYFINISPDDPAPFVSDDFNVSPFLQPIPFGAISAGRGASRRTGLP
jgi:hypothetical protein